MKENKYSLLKSAVHLRTVDYFLMSTFCTVSVYHLLMSEFLLFLYCLFVEYVCVRCSQSCFQY